MLVVLAGCYFSTAFYPDAERVIWMRSRNSELAYTMRQCVNILILINFHRYTIMLSTVDSTNPKKVTGLETRHGYFKLNVENSTKLDLSVYEISRVKWLYFTAIKPQNPQHRAWLHAIRGPAFLPAHLHCKFTVDTIKVR